MTTSNISSRFRSLQLLTAGVILVVSGRLGYSLAAAQLWLTLAVVVLKTCSTLALLLFLGRPYRTVEAGIFPSLGVLVLLVSSVSADFAVATLIH